MGQLKERLKRIEMHGDLGIHPGEDPLNNPLTPQDDIHLFRFVSQSRISFVIFDMKAVSEMDARYNVILLSAAQTLYEIVQEYQKRLIKVCFVKLRLECEEIFTLAGILDLVGNHGLFSKLRDAYEYCKSSHNGTIPIHVPEFSRSVNSILPFRRTPQSGSPEQQFTSFQHFRPNDHESVYSTS